MHDLLRCVEDAVDGEDDAVELVALVSQLLPAGGGQGVEPGAAVVLGSAQAASTHPLSRSRCRAGYSELSPTCNTSSETVFRWWAMP